MAGDLCHTTKHLQNCSELACRVQLVVYDERAIDTACSEHPLVAAE